MAYNYEYPYTDPNRYNSDWVLKEIKRLISEWASLNSKFDTLESKFADLKEYVNNYFKQLDLQEEVNTKIDEMAASGELASIINNYINYSYNIHGSFYDKMLDFSVFNEEEKQAACLFADRLVVINLISGNIVKSFACENFTRVCSDSEHFYLLRNDMHTVEQHTASDFSLVAVIDIEINIIDMCFIDNNIYFCDTEQIYAGFEKIPVYTLHGNITRLFNYKGYIGIVSSMTGKNTLQVINVSGKMIDGVSSLVDHFEIMGCAYIDNLYVACYDNGTLVLRGTVEYTNETFKHPVINTVYTYHQVNDVFVDGEYSGFIYDYTDAHPLSCVPNLGVLFNGFYHMSIYVRNISDRQITFRHCEFDMDIIGWDGTDNRNPVDCEVLGLGFRDCGLVYLKKLIIKGSSNLLNTSCLTGFSTKYLHLKDCKISPPNDTYDYGVYCIGGTSLSIDGLDIASTFKKFTFLIREGASMASYRVTFSTPIITDSSIYGGNEISSLDLPIIQHNNSYFTLPKTYSIIEDNVDLLTLEANGTFNIYDRVVLSTPELEDNERGTIVHVMTCGRSNKILIFGTNKNNAYLGVKIGINELSWTKLT